MPDAFEPVFAALHSMMLAAAPGMIATHDSYGHLVLKTPWNEPGKREPAWFGVVQIKKAYVSCHLMPLYCLPALLVEASTALLKRMQVKSCFNFKKAEPDLFAELAVLTRRCAEAYALPIITTPH